MNEKKGKNETHLGIPPSEFAERGLPLLPDHETVRSWKELSDHHSSAEEDQLLLCPRRVVGLDACRRRIGLKSDIKLGKRERTQQEWDLQIKHGPRPCP